MDIGRVAVILKKEMNASCFLLSEKSTTTLVDTLVVQTSYIFEQRSSCRQKRFIISIPAWCDT